MKTVVISDTHGKHEYLELPKGDMIIHAGDISSSGKLDEVQAFLSWYSNLPYEYKIFIAGNHDWFFEDASLSVINGIIPSDVIYLNDSGIEIEGKYYWGSPIQPWFYNWAFNKKRGAEIAMHWDLIPAHTDILITHGPPFGILDETTAGDHVGCEDLLDKIQNLKIETHIFGHIHEAYGRIIKDKTEYINASVLNQNYRLINGAVVLEY